MIDFLFKIKPYQLIFLLVFFVAIWKAKDELIFFRGFIFIVILFELIINHISAVLFGSNFISFNIFSYLCISYYLMVYIHYFKEEKWINWIKYIAVLLFGFAICRFIYCLNNGIVDTLTYAIGLFIVCGLILRYFYHLLYIDTFRPINNDPLFYFSIGILLFFTCSFPILIHINKLVAVDGASSAYSNLLQMGNIFLSLAYLAVPLCTKKEVQFIG
ncbi:hypothetical protein N9231_02585 [Saprospiraceae bacterium]|nr:hypothetical protein [Saprospiraceae bacterium]